MSVTLYSVGEEDFTPQEAKLFAEISKDPDHTYAPDNVSESTQLSIDMLVLGGFIERFRSPDGQWLDAWTMTSEAIAWMEDSTTRAELESLANA